LLTDRIWFLRHLSPFICLVRILYLD
jgi:hypothetical protein